MPEWRIIAVGRIGLGPEAALFDRYNARLRPPLTIVELAEARGDAATIRKREGGAMLAAVPPGARAVALDLGGEALDSLALSTRLAAWQESGRALCFLIGGAEGLDAPVLARADHAISFGALTWPHLLVRAMLAEQLYRAQCIARGHPYHRAIRPN